MFESLEQFRHGSVFDRYSINEIAIGVKHNKPIFVTLEGGYWINAWEVSSNQVLEFFVRRKVHYFNGNVLGSARQCTGRRRASAGIIRWQGGGTYLFLYHICI